MVLREMEDTSSFVLERAVRNMLSSSRGKRPEDILNNSDALAEYIADAYFVVRALESNNNQRFLQICQILSTRFSKREVANYVKLQTSTKMVEA